jgi:tRNA (guanosine-2'-O-)-methyltransferase
MASDGNSMRQLSKTELKRLQQRIAKARLRKVDLVFLLQNLDDPVNVGALFRIAEACGVREMILVGNTPAPPHPGISLTARGCERRVAWRHVKGIEEVAAALKGDSYHLVALELTRDAQMYTEYPYPDKVCLVLGSEGGGVWPKTLRLCDGTVFIPMVGKGPSLNVHVAAAVVAYHILVGQGTR